MRQAEQDAAEAARRATEERARRLAAAGFYPVQQAQAREAAEAAAAKKIAAREALELLEVRLRRLAPSASATWRDLASSFSLRPRPLAPGCVPLQADWQAAAAVCRVQ